MDSILEYVLSVKDIPRLMSLTLYKSEKSMCECNTILSAYIGTWNSITTIHRNILCPFFF